MTVVVAPPTPMVCMKFNVNINNNNDAVPPTATQAVVSYDNQPSQTQVLTNGSTSGPPSTFTAVGSGVEPISVVYLNSSGQVVGSETGTVTVSGGATGVISTTLTTVAGVTSATTTLSCDSMISQLNGVITYTANGVVVGTATVINGVVTNPTNLGALAPGTVVTVTFTQTGSGCAFCFFSPIQVIVGGAQECLVVLEPVGTVFAGVPTTVAATVTCKGVPVAGATVSFTTSNGLTATGTTNVAGVATATLTFPSTGTFTLNAIVTTAPTTECTCVGSTAVSVTVTVTPQPTCLVQLLVPSIVVAGQPTQVFALVTCNGAPVAGATVTFTGGATPVSATTDAAGVATATVTFNTAVPTTLTATVTTSPTTACACTGSKTSVTVIVVPQANCCVVLLPEDDHVAIGKPTELTAVVLCGCTPVSGATVVFTTAAGLVLGTAVTDSRGQAELFVTFVDPGNVTITATVKSPGNASCPCTNVSSTPVTIVVEKEVKERLEAFPACWDVNLPVPFPHIFRAKLRARISPPQAGIKIDFFVEDDLVGSAFTDATGNAILDAGLTPFQIITLTWKAVATIGNTRFEDTAPLTPCIPPV